MSFLAMALIAEMIFFGPLGLTVYDVSVRKTLIFVLVVCSIVSMLLQRQIVTWQMFFLLLTVLFLVIWGGVVPLTNGVEIKMSLAEMQPLIGLLLILPLSYLMASDGPELYLNVVKLCAFVMALVVIFVWASTNILGSFSMGMALRDFYIGLNGNTTGVYIGPMPDGTFRVMLINFIIFPLMVCYYNWKRTNLGWSAFYSLATFATGTRAFLLVVALTIGVSLLRSRPIIGAILAAAISGLAIVYVSNLQGLRIFEFSGELESSSSRFVQYFSLMSLFWQHAVFGAGFGASAAVIRSFEAPYSYELTYVALLAKIGIVGSTILVAVLGWGVLRLMRNSPNRTSIATLIIAFLFMTATNPYLINAVGITIVAVLIVLGVQAGESGSTNFPSIAGRHKATLRRAYS